MPSIDDGKSYSESVFWYMLENYILIDQTQLEDLRANPERIESFDILNLIANNKPILANEEDKKIRLKQKGMKIVIEEGKVCVILGKSRLH